MTEIFVSHVEEDADVALEIALGLEEAGYTTWCYEVDSIPGPSYLTQTGQAVEESRAIIMVISPNSLGSRQVTSEVIRAHESNSAFIPLLRGISHAEFQTRQPEWREAVGAASSTSIPPEGVLSILPRIITGLKTLGFTPNLNPDTEKIKQLRRVLDNIQAHGTPVVPMKPRAGAAGVAATSGRSGRGGGQKKWIKPALITFVLTVIAFIAFLVIEEIFMPGTAQDPKVETPKPVMPFIDDREEKTDSPVFSPTSPGEEKEDSPEYSPTSPGWVVKTDSPEYIQTTPIPKIPEIESPPEQVTIIDIPDDNLKKALNAVLGKSPGEDITDAELTNITYLNAERRGITDLTGIEHLVNLTSITLSENQISDISALSSLTKLTQIHLWNNQISDISVLSSLPGLAVLDLPMNQVSDISVLSLCTGLVDLNLENNQISDISALSSLTRLTRLGLGSNQISDLSALSSLTNLALLALGNNLVGDVSALSSLNNLTILDLRWNRVRNVSPLSSLAKLTVLELDGNQIKNVKPLASLNNLNELALRWNQIEDIQHLLENSGLSEWDVIYLGGTRLSDASLNVYIPQLEERGVEVSLEDRSR